ncbi:MAG: hypothetical protein HDQ96_06380 [Lachnospiraceae bacterium]|nr:hypothetical protein [Lachnospiraceae bacterium]
MKDKRRKIRLFVSVAILLFLVITIGSYVLYRKSAQVTGADAQYYDTMQNAGFASDDGIYHTNSTGFLYFFDYHTKQDVIVCNKPNCTHKAWYQDTPDEQRCNAYLPDALGGCGFVLEDSLYMFNAVLATQTSSIVQSGLDRTGQKEIASFENTVILPFVVDGECLYMSGTAILTEKDEDGMESPTGENETWLFKLDLQTGEITNLTERKRAYSSDLYIVGFYNGKIYYRESYFEKKYDGKNYEEAKHQVDWYSYDISADKSEQIYEDQLFQEAYLYENKFISMFGKDGKSMENRYEQFEIAVWDMDTGESQSIVTADKLLYYVDGKVFYVMEEEESQRYYYYDIEKGKTAEMNRGFMEYIHVWGAFGDYFLVTKDDPDTGIGDFFVILKKDFYNEKENYIPLTWKEES